MIRQQATRLTLDNPNVRRALKQILRANKTNPGHCGNGKHHPPTLLRRLLYSTSKLAYDLNCLIHAST
jgi:hypothetical protein